MKTSSASRRPALDFNVLAYRDCYECSMAIVPAVTPHAPAGEGARGRLCRGVAIVVASALATLVALFTQLGR